MEDMVMRYRFLRFPGGKAKAITFSYDDGCPADIRMSDTLSSYGLKGTFNLTSNRFISHLSDEDIRERFLDRGHEIAVHGAYHRAPGNITAVDGIRDVLECRTELESRFGMIVRGMAYPDTGITVMNNGTSYEVIKNYLSELGIVYSRTLGGDNNKFTLPADWHAWMPSAHHNNANILTWIDEFTSMDLSPDVYHARRFPRLFYIWGHSYEFDNNNNWEHLDEICKRISGKDDIWYATNIEIYEYVKAYESLIFSASGDIVYNPTLYDIYFDIDGKPYTIAPGQTLKID
ncbi:MAG: polysaccharide deacetylase family protein [Clostridia bacterium]|nr:polysaccharide deacetylase family protein [Clostridia bacterium]